MSKVNDIKDFWLSEHIFSSLTTKDKTLFFYIYTWSVSPNDKS